MSGIGDNGCEVGPFIDGELTESYSASSLDVIDPSVGARCWTVPAGSEQDVDRAVASARGAFEDGRWSDSAPSVRKRVLQRWAELIAASAYELDELDAREMGKPVAEAMASASAAAELTRYYSEAIDKITGDVLSSDRDSFVAQRRVPRGVVAAIVPWNFPTFAAMLKVGPCLAAGNSVILKPSELSSRSACRLAQLAVEAGVPAGVMNVVLGRGECVGRALGLNMQVDMLTFTGSTAVGKRLLQYAGQSNMKLVMAECGGKSPHIVFADGVDLESTSAAIAGMLVRNQGQVCSLGSRLLVQSSIHEILVEKVASKIKNVVIGNAVDPRTTFGPLASAQQCARVVQYIEMGLAEGAKVAAGGRRVLRESGGYFVEPTILVGVTPESRIAREEIFGPVLSVIPFEDELDAVRIANQTMYGLSAYVWTGRLSTGLRVAKGIRSSVMVNASAPSGEGPGHAYSSEPAKQSGIGIEGGMAGLETYLRRQTLWFNYV